MGLIRPRGAYLSAALCVIAMGLGWRHAVPGLPWPVAKIGGSALWGAMVYLLVSAARPGGAGATRMGIAFAIATLVELSRLWHEPRLDAFRLSTLGALLLGRIFSPWNLVFYASGITVAAMFERLLAIMPSRPVAPAPDEPTLPPGSRSPAAPTRG